MADAVTTSISRYSDASDSWAASASSLVSRNGRQALVHKGRGYAVSTAVSYLTSSEFYNDAGNYWQIGPTIGTGVAYAQPFTLQESSYLAAGHNGAPVMLTQKFSSGLKNAIIGAALEVI
jgi:hypothetical protein